MYVQLYSLHKYTFTETIPTNLNIARKWEIARRITKEFRIVFTTKSNVYEPFAKIVSD